MRLSQILAILAARRLIALWVFFLTVLVTTLLSFLLPKTYTSSATVVINAKGADPVTGQMLPAALMPGYMATQFDIIASRNVALKVVEKLQIAQNPTARAKFQEATNGEGDIKDYYADQFLQGLEVKPSRESSVIEISYRGPDPGFAAALANTFAEAYIQTSLELKTNPAKQASIFFDNQIKALRTDVEKAQAKLSAYQQEHGITTSEGRLDVEMARLDELSSQLVVAQAQTYDSNSRRTQLKRGSASESPEILANGLIQGLKSQLVQAEAKLSEASQRLGVNHPQYQAAQQDVNNLRQSIQIEIAKASSSVGQSAQVSQMREGDIKAALEAQKQRVLKLKGEQDEMAVMLREVDSAQRIYDSALLRFGQTSLESQSGQTEISVLNPATPPLKHSSPKILINIVLSIFLGALLAVGCAIAIEMLDRRVRSADDLSQLMALPVLAALVKQKPTFTEWLKQLFKKTKVRSPKKSLGLQFK
ncbi:MAG: chain length determinant protein EpsF [Methylophilaceae bacterium 17-44-8]|nr:MAG: chain length determinant protein EpsF [Methylophilales bacterium 28-44-11]OZA06692.1 MAG: chain length determinant protein EpsF [Methylophilaceae bacterium 17-44-8]